MKMHVLLENKPEGRYTATLLGWPDLVAQGATADEALAHLRGSLREHLSNASVVTMEVELPPADNPWLQLTDIFSSNPLTKEVEEEVATYRHQLDVAEDSQS